MSDATRRDNDATETGEWLDVKAAAFRLGISERSIQRRASSGDLLSKQDGRRLLVCVPVLEEVPQKNADSVATEAEMSRHDASNGESVATSALLEQLQSENAWLRAQVETHQQNEAELRRLMLADKGELNALREKVQMLLTAPPVEEPAQDAQETRSEKIGANADNLPTEPEEATNRLETGIVKTNGQDTNQPQRTDWWKFWKRK